MAVTIASDDGSGSELWSTMALEFEVFRVQSETLLSAFWTAGRPAVELAPDLGRFCGPVGFPGRHIALRGWWV
jgi:hypothetical protein